MVERPLQSRTKQDHMWVLNDILYTMHYVVNCLIYTIILLSSIVVKGIWDSWVFEVSNSHYSHWLYYKMTE